MHSRSAMTYSWMLLALFAIPGAAADPVQLALATRAQSDYDRVQTSAAPGLESAARCVQSQAAVVPITAAESLPLIHFRQGYCALTGALLSREKKAFEDAAAAFERALATWAARPREKRAPAEPEPAGMVALAAMARLAGGGSSAADTAAAAARLEAVGRVGSCPAAVMPAAQCREILDAAKDWLGWVAVRQGRLDDAAGLFDPSRAPGWSAWAAGRRAFESRLYDEAAEAYERTVQAWSAAEKNRTARIPQGLTLPADLAAALADLGGARIAAGDAQASLAPLEGAVRRNPNRSWAWFLLGRAREIAQDAGGALAAYNMAGRTALAAATDDAAGEGHFYRGVWSFRRGDLEAAEAEFTEAQNAGLPSSLAADAAAWRALAAVAGGGCGASREKLASAAALASPFFPGTEANAALASCGPPPARVSEVR